jgi:hypothetical protein
MDSKTMLETDSDVNLNRIQVRKNQISYGRGLRYKGQKGKRKGQNLTWNPALPNYYHHSKKGEIPCLSFFVEFIYDNKSNLKEINLISVPNGQLITHYGNILEPPKSFPLTGQEPPSMRVMIDKIKTPLLTKGWERKEQIYP